MAEPRTTASARRLSLSSLLLDPNNYRFIHESEYTPVSEEGIADELVQRRTRRLVLGERCENVKDLIDSFKANGFLPVDQIQVRQLGNGKYLVVEGNRRVAALMYLQSEFETKSIDLGRLDPELFRRIPVVFYEEADELHHLVLMGLKHISGNKKWPTINQAKLIRRLMDEHNMSEDDICKAVGIGRKDVRTALKTLALIDEYLDSDYGDQFEQDKYSIFREIINSVSLRSWIGWDDNLNSSANKQNLEKLFSWISEESADEEEDYDSLRKAPVILKALEIRELAKIINDEKAVANLDNTRNLVQASMSSEVLGSNKLKNALELIGEQVNTAFSYAGFISPADISAVTEIKNKIEGLLVSRGVEPRIIGERRKSSPFNAMRRSHFSTVEFGAYRRLRNLYLRELKRVNVIAGVNNAGKTSLLEGLYLLTQQNDISALLHVLQMRGKLSGKQPDPSWLIGVVPDGVSLHGDFDGVPAEVSLNLVENEDASLNKSFYLGSISLQSRYGDAVQHSHTDLYTEKDRVTTFSGVHVLCNATFSSPFSHHNAELVRACYTRSVETRTKEKIVRFIESMVDPGIADIELVDGRDRFLVSLKSGDVLDLSQLGEGVQRVFHIALLFAYSQNGIVLIDEIENAIHAKLLDSFAIFLCDLAEEFNVQVFLSSHSKECIDAFVRSGRESSISAYALTNSPTGISAEYLSGERLHRLVELADLDIRMMQ